MIIHGLFLFLLISAVPEIGHSQNYIFKVVAKRGETQYKTMQRIDWMPLKHGTGLSEDDIIKIGEDSYLGLIHSTGKITEVDESGEMRISDLQGKLKQMKRGLPAKYTDFVMNTVATNDSDPIRTRGADKIHIYLPSVSLVYSNQVLILWEQDKDLSEYEVEVSDIMGDEILKESVTGTSLLLDLTNVDLAKEDDFIIEISSNQYQSEENAISKLSIEQSEAIKTELEYYQQLLDVEEPTKKVLIGAYFEKNNLILDAMYYYYLSVNRDINNPMFQAFLGRHGMLR